MANAEKQESQFTKQTIIDNVNEYKGKIDNVILYMDDQKTALMAANISPISFMKFLGTVAKEDPRLLHAIKAMAFIL